MQQRLITVRLLGAFGREFGRVHHLAIESAAEAVRALCVLFPAFKGRVIEEGERGVCWRIVTDDPRGMSEEMATMGIPGDQLVLAPIVAGRGNVGRILAGVAFVALGIFTGGAGLFGIAALSKSTLLLTGGSLILGGVAGLLTRTPRSDVDADTKDLESSLYTNAAGTGGQGSPVPVCYGKRRIENPLVISFSLGNLPVSRSNAGPATDLMGVVAGRWL